jgi:hypothetical protein
LSFDSDGSTADAPPPPPPPESPDLDDTFYEVAQPEPDHESEGLSDAFNNAAAPEAGSESEADSVEVGDLTSDFNDAAALPKYGELSAEFYEVTQPEPVDESGSLSDAFNDAAEPDELDAGKEGGDGGAGAQGRTDAGSMTTELVPGLDNGQVASEQTDADDMADAASNGDTAEVVGLDADASNSLAGAAGLRTKFNESAAAGDHEEAADAKEEADALEADAATQRAQAQQLRKGPGL